MRGDARADSSLLCSFTLKKKKKFLFAVVLFNSSRPRLARHTRVRARRERDETVDRRNRGPGRSFAKNVFAGEQPARRCARGSPPPRTTSGGRWMDPAYGRRRPGRPAARPAVGPTPPTPDRCFRSTTRSRERERLAASVRSAPRRRATSPGSRRFMCGNQPVVREVEYARIEVGLNIRRWRP